MPIQQLIDNLESLRKDYPHAEIVDIEQFLEEGNWKYRIYFDSNESEDKYIEIED